MIMSLQYLPVSSADRVIWLNNFSGALPQFAAALGLTTAEVQNVQRDAAYYAYTLQLQNDARQYLQSLTQYKNSMQSTSAQAVTVPLPVLTVIASPPPAVPPGIFGRVSTLVLRIKRSTAYTTAIGQSLGIIAPTSNFDPNNAVPELSVRLDGGHPFLKWKKGAFDAMAIYVDRGDGNGFVFLRHTVKTDYLDTEPLPANTFSVNWSYRIKGMIGDDEVGQFSQVISINVIRT
jgi:hypothetical protein